VGKNKQREQSAIPPFRVAAETRAEEKYGELKATWKATTYSNSPPSLRLAPTVSRKTEI